MAIWVNSGTGNGLLADGTKPFSEPMLTKDSFKENLTENAQMYILDKWVWKLSIEDYSCICQGLKS